VAGGWRELHDELRVIKSRSMRREERTVRMGEMRNACRILVGNPEGKRPHSDDLQVSRRIMLEWVLGK
jgi:hypothetical protein